MKVLIAGVDGYLGWPLALVLAKRGHQVGGIDAYFRRDWVAEMGSVSGTPIERAAVRLQAFYDHYNVALDWRKGDLTDYNTVLNFVKSFRPDAIVHLGEMPSAPYSMIDAEHAIYTHKNNLIGTLNILYAMKEAAPDAHLLKLGTMGEYGTPNIDIPEGFFEIEYRGRKDKLPFPRQAGSWYHQTKVHDTNNITMACKIWGMRSTDIMQGVVFGTHIDEMSDDERLLTRFDYDQCFGTAINRFCAQAVIDHPLTIYGKGNQKRGFLSLKDSMQCLTLALENPPEKGEYRVFNQFEEVYSITDLANFVKEAGNGLDLNVKIENYQNPRVESENHHYNPDHQHLLDLGYKPTRDIKGEIASSIQMLIKYADRIRPRSFVLVPDIRWSGERHKVGTIADD